MNDREIKELYKLISIYHQKHLASKGVFLPKLKNSSGTYTKDALVLIFLAQNYPNTKVISKQELTEFVKTYYSDITDVQQARHLSMQKGWNILSGQRGDKEAKNQQIPSGSYKLISLETPYSAFAKERRKGFSGDFETIKEKYNFHCATCGSKEGKEHLFRKNIIVELQKGHMDPNKPLIEENIIPQCQICNRSDRNRWIYDKTGRVIEIANTQDGIRVVKTFLKKPQTKSRLIFPIFSKPF
jgi:hypothetical protein